MLWAPFACDTIGYDAELAITGQHTVHALPPTIGLQGFVHTATLVALGCAKQVLVEQQLHFQHNRGIPR